MSRCLKRSSWPSRLIPDLQDKDAWCDQGEADELRFLEEVAPRYGLPLIVHPRKAQDVYETDFQTRDGSWDVDLKHIQTPFFTAGRYKYDPQHTITLNHKDYIRYRYKYPEWREIKMLMLFWVQFSAHKDYGTDIAELEGLWSLPINTLDQWIRKRTLACHSYEQRQGECGSNAKHSWLIDLRWCKEHDIKQID